MCSLSTCNSPLHGRRYLLLKLQERTRKTCTLSCREEQEDLHLKSMEGGDTGTAEIGNQIRGER